MQGWFISKKSTVRTYSISFVLLPMPHCSTHQSLHHTAFTMPVVSGSKPDFGRFLEVQLDRSQYKLKTPSLRSQKLMLTSPQSSVKPDQLKKTFSLQTHAVLWLESLISQSKYVFDSTPFRSL